jgi:hypothetical protein
MERRYLAATLAMAATFAIVTHGFNSGMLAQLQHRPTALVSELRCTAETLTGKLLDKVNRSFGPRSAEEAQLRVELNLPAPMAAIPPVPPALMAPPPQALRTSGASCPARRMRTDVHLPNLAQMQAKLAAMQVRLQSQEMQRELARAAREEARANRLEARFNPLPCRGSQSVGRSSGRNFDFHYERLARDISAQVNRSLEQSFRNF